MKILIIGSSGFIGGNLYKYFYQQKSFKVSDCDIASSANYIIHPTNPDFNAIFQVLKYDLCINASGASSVPDSFTNLYKDYSLNVLNIVLLLEAIRKNNPACKFINLSSAAVYGNPKYLPVDEKHPVAPLSPYGWHKYQSELLCLEFHKIYQIPTCSLRIFSAYGEGMKKQLLWDIFQKAKKNDPIVLSGTGKESRDFIHISDLVRAIHIVAVKGDFAGEVINVASGQETTIQTVAERFQQNLNISPGIQFSGTERKGDPKNWKADISKLVGFGFKPEISIEKGIENYIQWAKELK